MWGLEHSERIPDPDKTVLSRKARYSYGIKCTERFDYARGHLDEDSFIDVKGERRARNQMIWKLTKGDTIEEGKELHLKLGQNVQASFLDAVLGQTWDFSNTLYYCADDVPPTRAEPSKQNNMGMKMLLIVAQGVKVLCEVEYTVQRARFRQEMCFKDHLTGQKWRRALFDFCIRLHNTTLEYVVLYKGEQVAHTVANYKKGCKVGSY